ncbi:MAG: HAMP domain-containing sensor histidine kinase [Clostridium sp.]|uniref:sensor histidine kinase n=1 Tax=Clostridium sp. TaxID=1506 RepID=UPI00304BA73E
MTTFKTLLRKWFRNSTDFLIIIEFLIIFIISITVLPSFIYLTFSDYDNYTNNRSVRSTALFNENKFKNEMLQNNTIEFRERLLSFTDGFSKIIHCENDENAELLQSSLVNSLSEDVGVLLLDKLNNRWFSNRDWFNDYPFNQLPPDEALLKLSTEDDVFLYSSNDLSHYTSPYGYYNGAYTPAMNNLEEIYFIRGTQYSYFAKNIRHKLYLSIPFISIFTLLITKHIFLIKSFSLKHYTNKFKNVLLIRTIKAVNILFINIKYIFKNLFYDLTLISLLIFWVIYLPLYSMFSSTTQYLNFNSNIIVIASFLIIITNVCVRYLESINGRKKLIKYVHKLEGGDMDIDLSLSNLGNISDLAFEIDKLKVNYKSKVENALKSERFKTELITNVSHDLKTPLTSIINYVDILKDENLSKDEIKDYVAILDNKSNKLKNLVEDLFEISKMSSGQINLSKSELDIVELIHQSLGELSFLGEANHLKFKVIGDKSCNIEVDGSRMSRVMDNLICNAIKYSLENSRVYLQVSSIGEYCEIVVKNISKYDLDFNEEEILERFVRGDKSRGSNIEGSGLGLAIASTIVELHGGTLKINCDGDLFKVIIKLPLSNK